MPQGSERTLDKKEKQPIGLARRIVTWLLLAILLIFLFFALIGLWTWKVQSDYESTAVPYLKSVIPEITTWDPEAAWSYFDDEVTRLISREDHDKIMRYLSSLGELKSLAHPQFQQVTSSATLRTGTKKLVFYLIPAKFENGDATMNVALVDRDGKFSVYHFRVNSMALVEGASQYAVEAPKGAGDKE
jgi:hypothetical protein